MKILFTFFIKQDTLMGRLSVLSLPLQLGLPDPTKVENISIKSEDEAKKGDLNIINNFVALNKIPGSKL
jgi:hypothetical protein